MKQLLKLQVRIPEEFQLSTKLICSQPCTVRRFLAFTFLNLSVPSKHHACTHLYFFHPSGSLVECHHVMSSHMVWSQDFIGRHTGHFGPTCGMMESLINRVAAPFLEGNGMREAVDNFKSDYLSGSNVEPYFSSISIAQASSVFWNEGFSPPSDMAP